MAGKEELLYRPDIRQPVRKLAEVVPEKPIDTNAPVDGTDKPDTITEVFYKRMEELKLYAKELAKRSTFLMDLILEDMDGYIGEAPGIILQYIHDLTGIDFDNPTYVYNGENNQSLANNQYPESNQSPANNQYPGNSRNNQYSGSSQYSDTASYPYSELGSNYAPLTDPVFTLPANVIKCIFRVANYYNNNTYDDKVLAAVENWDSAAFNNAIMDKATKLGYMDSVVYGLKMLWMVVKVCYVIIIHYTVGYPCALFSTMLNFEIPYKIKVSKKFKVTIEKWNLGKTIAKVFGKLETRFLKIVGFACADENEIPNCNDNSWEDIKFRKITCCTTTPFFFTPTEAGQPVYNLSKCFEQWIKSEIDPTPPGETSRIICSLDNSDDLAIVPTKAEVAKATAIAKYLTENPSKSDSMARSDIYTIQSAKAAADKGVMMTETIQSSLNVMTTYTRSEPDKSKWNCFGYTPETKTTNDQKGNIIPKRTAPGSLIIEQGNYFQEYMEKIDDSILSILKYADKIVIGTANLAKWGSSKQLCCYIYLLVTIASLFHSLISKGSICEELDSENEDGFANAMRNEFRWAIKVEANQDVQKFTALLKLIQQIIDIFIRKMERSLLIHGLVLPLGEMFEMIKLTLVNGLSSFMDILFAPLDLILVNIKAVPEIRAMINNQCFGFDKLLDFLSCSIGSLKYGLLLEVDDIINKFKLTDITLLDDIYLSRTRMEFLKALSRLIGIMINMILQLKDCYASEDTLNEISNVISPLSPDNTPTTLPNDPSPVAPDDISNGLLTGVIDQQQTTMYNGVADLIYLLKTPENIKYIDDCAVSLFGQNFLPDKETITKLESDPSRLSATFGEIGIIGDTMIQNDLFCTNCEKKVFKISDFVDDTGNILPPAEFMKRAEAFSDVKISDIETDMAEIFKILRGPVNV